MLKTYNCDAQGNPVYTPRNWWDAWMLIAEIVMCLGVSSFLLVSNVIYRDNSTDIVYDFKQQLLMAWDTVPCYIRSVKRGK